jgi:voltage-gated potassium channel
MSIFIKILKKIFANTTKTNIIRVIGLALILNLLFGALFYYAEKDVQTELTFLDAIWWAMVTMTTVGYGDFYAQTSVGRFLISYPTMLLGIGIIGYLVGVVAESMLERGSKKRKGLLEIKMKNHIIVCNFPGDQKILRLKNELKRSRRYGECEFVLVTNDLETLPESLVEQKISFVKGDPVREDVLLRANVLECAGVFILAEDTEDPGSDTKTFAIGTQIEMMEREEKRPIKVVVEMVSQSNLKMMKRSKVDAIVSADGIMDVLIAQEFMYPGLHDVFHEILSNASGSQFYILDSDLGGQSFGDLQCKAIDFNKPIQVVGLKRRGQSIMNPEKTFSIEDNDKLIVLANSRADFDLFQTEAQKS